jgi:hypothetical protein
VPALFNTTTQAIIGGVYRLIAFTLFFFKAEYLLSLNGNLQSGAVKGMLIMQMVSLKSW